MQFQKKKIKQACDLALDCRANVQLVKEALQYLQCFLKNSLQEALILLNQQSCYAFVISNLLIKMIRSNNFTITSGKLMNSSLSALASSALSFNKSVEILNSICDLIALLLRESVIQKTINSRQTMHEFIQIFLPQFRAEDEIIEPEQKVRGHFFRTEQINDQPQPCYISCQQLKLFVLLKILNCFFDNTITPRFHKNYTDYRRNIYQARLFVLETVLLVVWSSLRHVVNLNNFQLVKLTLALADKLFSFPFTITMYQFEFQEDDQLKTSLQKILFPVYYRGLLKDHSLIQRLANHISTYSQLQTTTYFLKIIGKIIWAERNTFLNEQYKNHVCFYLELFNGFQQKLISMNLKHQRTLNLILDVYFRLFSILDSDIFMQQQRLFLIADSALLCKFIINNFQINIQQSFNCPFSRSFYLFNSIRKFVQSSIELDFLKQMIQKMLGQIKSKKILQSQLTFLQSSKLTKRCTQIFKPLLNFFQSNSFLYKQFVDQVIIQLQLLIQHYKQFHTQSGLSSLTLFIFMALQLLDQKKTIKSKLEHHGINKLLNLILNFAQFRLKFLCSKQIKVSKVEISRQDKAESERLQLFLQISIMQILNLLVDSFLGSYAVQGNKISFKNLQNQNSIQANQIFKFYVQSCLNCIETGNPSLVEHCYASLKNVFVRLRKLDKNFKKLEIFIYFQQNCRRLQPLNLAEATQFRKQLYEIKYNIFIDEFNVDMDSLYFLNMNANGNWTQANLKTVMINLGALFKSCSSPFVYRILFQLNQHFISQLIRQRELLTNIQFDLMILDFVGSLLCDSEQRLHQSCQNSIIVKEMMVFGPLLSSLCKSVRSAEEQQMIAGISKLNLILGQLCSCQLLPLISLMGFELACQIIQLPQIPKTYTKEWKSQVLMIKQLCDKIGALENHTFPPLLQKLLCIIEAQKTLMLPSWNGFDGLLLFWLQVRDRDLYSPELYRLFFQRWQIIMQGIQIRNSQLCKTIGRTLFISGQLDQRLQIYREKREFGKSEEEFLRSMQGDMIRKQLQ